MLTRLGLILALLASASCLAADPGRTRLVYFNQANLIEEIDGKAVGRAADLIRTLAADLPGIDELSYLPVKRLENALANEKVIAIGLARLPRRELLGAVWMFELFADDYRFATLVGHAPVKDLESARSLPHIGCNVGSAPADFLIGNGFVNLENAHYGAQAEMLRAGRIDAWFERGNFIRSVWSSRGYSLANLQWSPPFPAPAIWVAASSKVDPALIETIVQRYDALKREGRLDPFFSSGR